MSPAMTNHDEPRVPADGQPIRVDAGGKLTVPERPIVPFIEGDGTGPDIWAAAVRVFDVAVEKAYGGARKLQWIEVFAGQKAYDRTGQWLPEATLEAFRDYRVGIKGPLTTPVGGGISSLNVALRQILDLYVCLRPVRWYPGVPSPVKNPQDVDVVLFRENSEDIYAGVEWKAESPEARKLIRFLQEEMGVKKIRFPETSGIGIKPISREGTERLVRAALKFAIEHGRKSLTLVHKGNIMKFTEGAFRDWGYEVAEEQFAEKTIREDQLGKGDAGGGDRVVIKDRIADAMFQQVLLRPAEYSVIATPNLNGDYLSDACAAQVGGLGMAPGANMGDGLAVFEATHGTAPKYAGQDKVNPGSLILSGVMMFEALSWHDVAEAIVGGLEAAIGAKTVTYDLARQLSGATLVPTSGFADEVIGHITGSRPA